MLPFLDALLMLSYVSLRLLWCSLLGQVQTRPKGTLLLNALIAEMEALEDQGEVFDTLMGLRDDRRVENTKLMGLNELITQAEEEIEMKEAYVKLMDG
nr:hypothetical protein [Tanacetum cinerariifolium]